MIKNNRIISAKDLDVRCGRLNPEECEMAASFMVHPEMPQSYEDYFYVCGEHLTETIREIEKACVVHSSWCGGPGKGEQP